MLAIRYSMPAKQDLTEIAAFLERERSAAVAKRVISRIRQRVRTLRRDGTRRMERPVFGPGRRVLHINPYLAFYRVIGQTVYIQRILHGARNITLDMLED